MSDVARSVCESSTIAPESLSVSVVAQIFLRRYAIRSPVMLITIKAARATLMMTAMIVILPGGASAEANYNCQCYSMCIMCILFISVVLNIHPRLQLA